MATDVERLVVRLEATQRQFEKQLARANGTADRRARNIERRFQRMNKTLNAQFVGLGRGLAAAFAGGASIRGAQRLIDASIRIENALKVAGLAGDELAMVYDRLFASAQRNAAPLESLTELYGRVALVQGELGISTEELLGFTEKVSVALRVSGQSASESSGALLQLSQALGSGVVRAEEFNSILEGALPIAQAAAAGLEEAGGSVARLRNLMLEGRVSSEAFFRAFEAGSVILDEKVAAAEFTVSQSFIRLQNVLIDAAGRFDDGSDASRRLAGALDDLATYIENVDFSGATNTLIDFIEQVGWGVGKLTEFRDAIYGVAKAISEWTGGNAIGQWLDEQTRGTMLEGMIVGQPTQLPRITTGGGGRGYTPGTPGDPNAVAGAVAEAISRSAPVIHVDTISLDDYPIGGTGGGSGGSRARRGGGGGGGSRAAAAYREAEEAARDFDAAQRDAAMHAEQVGSAVGDAISGLVGAFADGKLEARELLGIVASIVRQLMSINGAGGFGGGLLSSILGSVFHDGGVVGAGGRKRSVSPALFAAAPRYHQGGIAGLRPGEVPAILEKGEIVIPKGQSFRSGTSVVINAPINAPGADAAQLARVEQSVKDLARNVPKMVDKRTDTRNTRKIRP